MELQRFLVEGRIEAGCDEAGRGPLVGPVTAAAVILPPDFHNDIINDSKQLTERKRNLLRPVIEEQAFRAKLGRNFIVPANSFDNVKGQFPIGFFIWHTEEKVTFEHTTSDVYAKNGDCLGEKGVYSYDNTNGNIGKWVNSFASVATIFLFIN